MKKAILPIALLSGLVSAQSTLTAGDLTGPWLGFVCAFLSIVEDIAGPIAAFVLVWAGVVWIASRDDPSKRKDAKQRMNNILIGLVIILLARAIASMVSGTGVLPC